MSSFVFIDSRVADIERLIAGLAPDTQVVILDPALDGVTQIPEALAGVTDLDSIHIISHGSSGTLYLGSTILTEDNLDDYEEELAQIGASLGEQGDLLLYGCSAGAGTTGESFIASLTEYTGADVAASTDPTGSAALGGDWVLEASTGSIETAAIESSQFDALLAAPSLMTSGGFDTTFGGGDGKVTTSVGTSFDLGRSVVLQPDGKILVGGNAFIDGSQSDFALVRYNADGTLDSTFGGDGIVTTPIGTSADSIFSVALQADGKIVVAGNHTVEGVPIFALARYDTSGGLDITFGGGDGIVTTPVGTFDQLTSMVLQADARIVVAGYAGNGSDDDFALARYTTAGVLDATFGGDGIVTTPLGTSNDRIFAVALQADGKIVVAGASIVSGTHYDFALARYNTDGTLDDTFDGDSGTGDGIVTTPIGTGIDRITGIVIQPDGKILVAGWSDTDTSEFGNTHFALARYNTDGTLDVSFDGDGIVITPIGLGRDEINSVVLQTDGKIVVSGFSFGSNNDFAVARYNTDGSLDNTFAGDGIETFAVGTGADVANSVALQPDGAIVVAGSSVGASTDNDFALIRVFGGPGIPDVTAGEGGPFSFTFHANTFTDDGPLTYTTNTLPDWLDFDAATRTFSGTPGSGDVGAVSITLTATDGTAQSVNDIFVLTVEANDSPALTPLKLDPLFDTDGKVVTAIGTGTDQINGVVLQQDGKIVVAGFRNPGTSFSANIDFALARYNTDGSLDDAFDGDSSGNGIVITAIGTGIDQINAVALQDDGKIVVAGYRDPDTTVGGDTDFVLARYNADGTLDSTFDGANNGNGIVITPIDTGEDRINAVALQDDGSIVVAGLTAINGADQDFCIARYGTDGNLDGGFGTGGHVITSIGTGIDVITSLALQADGKIVVAGYGFTGPTTNVDFALARYNTDGTLDATFDGDSGTGNGIVTTAIGAGTSQDRINGVAIQADGKIVVAGTGALQFALARYNTDGTLDNTFGGDGKVTTQVGVDLNSITSLVLQDDGKIVVVGRGHNGSNFDVAVARYNTDGTLDSTFDEDGVLTIPIGTASDAGNSVALQPDGSIVIGGTAGNDFGLLRLRPFIEDQAADEDSPFSYTPPANTFVDPEGHALACSATLADGSPLSTTWLSFNPNTRTFAGTPENDDVGALAVKLIATDNWGASSSTVFNINVGNTNDAPTLANPLANQTAQTNEPFSFAIPANTFDDVDVGDGFTYSATLENGSDLPGWLDIDPNTGELSGTPGNGDFLDSYSIKVIFTDVPGNESADDIFVLSIPTGGPNNDTLEGTAGPDTIDGGGGADAMSGLQGNDTYIVDHAGDTTIETNAVDTDEVNTSVNYTLPVNVEILRLTGAFAINGTGNALNNQMFGNGVANRLNGGAGIDSMTGGAGNDTYVVDDASDQVNEVSGAGSGNDLVESSVSDTLAANVERMTLTGSDNLNATGNTLANTLTGNSGSNSLAGSSGNDSLVGNAGNDTLNGGVGLDTMSGGLGNDTYIVDSASDQITENSGAGTGTDVVQASVAWTLQPNVENLVLTGTAALSGTGNVLLNNVTGNSGSNVLTGGDGNDTLNGSGGNDSLNGGAGNDSLDGGAGNDTLRGEGGNDTLRGGTGTDSMVGGSGNDVFFVDTTTDVVVETANGGTADQAVITIPFTDQSPVFVLPDYVEWVTVEDVNSNAFFLLVRGNSLDNILTGGAGADSLDGAAGDDTLEGAGGDDTLVGGTGADSMEGGDGSDLYYVDDAGDEVVEADPAALALGPAALANPIDIVRAAINYTLTANVENLVLTGSATIGTGNALGNVLTGNGLANLLSGVGGNDTLNGGAGNDVLSGGTGTDTVSYQGGASSGVTVSLALTGAQATGGAGSDTLSAVERLTGSTYADQLTGNTGANVLTGLGGNDRLSGGGGNDTVIGGTGKDTLTGGAGQDRFDFEAALNATTNVDRITDFSAANDTMRLDNDIFTAFAAANVTLAAGAFYKGAGKSTAHDASDRIIYNTTNGNVYYDADGQGGVGAKLFATLNNTPAITNADFFIVG